jgi:hypothetical protein
METGKVLTPTVWCRNRQCREAGLLEHHPDDGCTCHPVPEAAGPRPDPRITVLRARAQRLKAFACRACGRAARVMVEYPELFFRCAECAAANRWPVKNAGGA